MTYVRRKIHFIVLHFYISSRLRKHMRLRNEIFLTITLIKPKIQKSLKQFIYHILIYIYLSLPISIYLLKSRDVVANVFYCDIALPLFYDRSAPFSSSHCRLFFLPFFSSLVISSRFLGRSNIDICWTLHVRLSMT